MPRALKIAIACATAPLLLATLIYSTWRFTRWSWLETAGIFLILAGFISVVTGALFLLRYVWREFRMTRTFRSACSLQVVVIGGLLFANFPAAGFFTLSAINVATRYTLHVFNESESAIESFVVTGPGVRVELGPIASGARVQRHLGFAGDGSLDFSARQGRSGLSGQLDGYVTPGLGGDTTIRILPDGKYELQKRNG